MLLDERQLPPIFQYESYRNLLSDTVEAWRSAGKYSTRSFAQQVGLGSSSFLKMVIDGKRNLAPATAWKIAHAFEFRKEEIHFFDLLVRFNQEEDLEQKDRLYRELMTYRSQFFSRGTSDELYVYYSNWFHVALRELLAIESMQSKPPEELAALLGIGLEEAEQALDRLERLSFIEKKASGWAAKPELIKTPDELQHLHIRNFHRAMIQLALESVDAVSSEERDLSSLTLPLSRSSYLKVCKMISDLRLQINALYSHDPKAQQVYQINLQVFPLSKAENSTDKTAKE